MSFYLHERLLILFGKTNIDPRDTKNLIWLHLLNTLKKRTFLQLFRSSVVVSCGFCIEKKVQILSHTCSCGTQPGVQEYVY